MRRALLDATRRSPCDTWRSSTPGAFPDSFVPTRSATWISGNSRVHHILLFQSQTCFDLPSCGKAGRFPRGWELSKGASSFHQAVESNPPVPRESREGNALPLKVFFAPPPPRLAGLHALFARRTSSWSRAEC